MMLMLYQIETICSIFQFYILGAWVPFCIVEDSCVIKSSWTSSTTFIPLVFLIIQKGVCINVYTHRQTDIKTYEEAIRLFSDIWRKK